MYVFIFLRNHSILTSLQSDIFSGDIIVNQLVNIHNLFCKAVDESKEVLAEFCDYSKVFDRVWHEGMLYKLQTVGITGPLFQWFTDYLNNSKQRMGLPDAFRKSLP